MRLFNKIIYIQNGVMKKYYLLFLFMISCIQTAYTQNDTGRVKTSILFGSIIYLYPTYKHIYPYFPNSKDSAMLYKNALNGMVNPIISVEFNISKNPKHTHGFGISYGVFRSADGPFWYD